MAEALIEQHNSETYLSVGDYVEAYKNGDLRSLSYLNTGILSFVTSGLFYGADWYLENLKVLDMPNVHGIQGKLFGSNYSQIVTVEEINCDNLTFIGSDTFHYCTSLSFLSLPNVSYIESGYYSDFGSYNAFRGCYNLKEVYLNNCEIIGENAFSGCGIKSIYLQECKEIRSLAFANCHNLSDIYIPKVSSIYYGAFYNCTNLKNLHLPGYLYIDNNMNDIFAETGSQAYSTKRSVYYENVSYISLSSYAFYGIYGADVYFPQCKYINNIIIATAAIYLDSCESIVNTRFSFYSTGSGYFYAPKLSIITENQFSASSTSADYLRKAFLPNCKIIEEYAFNRCYYLSSIVLSNCEEVYAYAFHNCSSLSLLYLPNCISFTFKGNDLTGFWKYPQLSNNYILPKLPELIMWSEDFRLSVAISTGYSGGLLNCVNRIEFGGSKIVIDLERETIGETGALGVNELICDNCEEIEINTVKFNTNYKLESDDTWINYKIDGLTNFYGQYIWIDNDNDIYYSSGYNHYKLNRQDNKWDIVEWKGLISFSGNNIWTDRDNIYYSYNSNQYVLDKNTSTWSPKTWNGLTEFSGNNIWTDGDNIYYSSDSAQYVLDKNTSTWSPKTWNGLTSFSGKNIWTDGDNIYYSYNSNQYILDKSTSTWSKVAHSCKTFDIDGNNIWTDGDNIYYSYNSHNLKQYVLNKSTRIWSEMTWSGLTDFNSSAIWTDEENIYCIRNLNNKYQQYILDKSTSTWSNTIFYGICYLAGSQIWTDGENIYYSKVNDGQYILNKETNKWTLKNWHNLVNFDNTYIWTDGDNIYYSNGSNHYVLDKATSTWESKTWNGLTEFNGNNIWTDRDNIYYSNNRAQYILDKDTSTWNSKIWYNSQYIPTYGANIWTDGDNIYYSDSSNQYVLDKTTYTWESKTWSGYTSINSFYIWTDGDNIYYSYSSNQYVLDKSTSTWSKKIWSGLTSFTGNNIWTDGENIYYSSDSAQYVLDKSTSTWVESIFLGPFYNISQASYIWTDGDNIYYSNGSNHYVLDKATSTWESKTWNGYTSIYGSGIWTDGDNIYFSGSTNHYVLDKATSTWSKKTWSGLRSFSGSVIWTDGNDIYYSSYLDQYVLDKSTSTWSKKIWSGLTSFTGNNIWTDGDNIYYSGSSKQYVLDKGTSNWIEVDFYNPYYFYGHYIWTDKNNNIYNSNSDDGSTKFDNQFRIWNKISFNGLQDVDEFYGNNIWTDGDNIYYSYMVEESEQALQIWNTCYIDMPKLKKTIGDGGLYFEAFINNPSFYREIGNLNSSYVLNFNVSFPSLEEGYIWINGGKISASAEFPGNFNISLPNFSNGILILENYQPIYNFSINKTILPSIMKTLYLREDKLESLTFMSMSTFITRGNVYIKDLTLMQNDITNYCDQPISEYSPYYGLLPKFNSGYNIGGSTYFSNFRLPNCTVINTNVFNNYISVTNNFDCPMLETLNLLSVSYISTARSSRCVIHASSLYMPKLSNISYEESTSEIYMYGSSITLGFSKLPENHFKLEANTFLSLSNLQFGIDYTVTNHMIKSVYLPKCTYIGSSIFDGCSYYLSNIDLPECLSIYEYAFRSCSKLKYFSAPKLKYIGSRALYGTSLTLLELLNVEEIGDYGLPSYINLVKFGNRIVSMHSGINIRSTFLIQVPAAYYSRYLSAEPYATWLSQYSSKFGIIQY